MNTTWQILCSINRFIRYMVKTPILILHLLLRFHLLQINFKRPSLTPWLLPQTWAGHLLFSLSQNRKRMSKLILSFFHLMLQHLYSLLRFPSPILTFLHLLINLHLMTLLALNILINPSLQILNVNMYLTDLGFLSWNLHTQAFLWLKFWNVHLA